MQFCIVLAVKLNSYIYIYIYINVPTDSVRVALLASV